MYRLEYKKSVAKDLRVIPKQQLRKIVRRIQTLANEPRGSGILKLQGEDQLYRVRQGDYRIIYNINDDVVTVLIIKVGHRKDVYER
ncbi:type II toxin-antitoxin system RelE/ParE family toxin [Polaromonas sp.]|nr:type II toxin-antitoxin system RelE/ParE family toxin [Candidatus Saccharibacteria bacterium]